MVEERAQRASRNHRTQLAAAIAAAGWPALLPEHRADGEDQPVGRPTCVAAHRLSDRLTLAVVQDERRRSYPVPLVLESEAVRRAHPGDGAAEALIRLLSSGDQVLDEIEVASWHHSPATGERAITVDQTNESVIVGERAVVKWAFVADPGPHPAPSLLAELDRNGFTGMPRPWGAVQWRPADGSAPRLLALVTDFVAGAVDGWTWVVDHLRGAATNRDVALAESAGRAVGELVASFHRALADTARSSTEAESASWRIGALSDLDRALAETSGEAHALLRRHADEVHAVLASIPVEVAAVMRVHGDLHVGQVLRSGSRDQVLGSGNTSHDDGPRDRQAAEASYVLTDFDGNPIVPAAERIAEQPAAVDVAGMAQSFTHAGLVVARHNPSLDRDVVVQMAAAARATFLDAYRSGLGDRVDLLDERLLRPFALRQVCREFTYAATHLPRWSYVPAAALPLLLRPDRPWSEENA